MKKRKIKRNPKPLPEREPKLITVAGRRGVGKTYETLRMMQTYVRNNHRTGRKGRKVLIFDVNNEFGNVKADHNPKFYHVKDLPLSQIKAYGKSTKPDLRRITPFKENGDRMSLDEMASTLGVILENYKNGLLLIEDITKYVTDSLPGDLIGSICTLRHVSTDVIIHFQMVQKLCHPKLWSNANEIRLHRAEDTIAAYQNRVKGNIEHMRIMEYMIRMKNNQGDKRFCCYLDKDYGKVRGNFTVQDFTEAIASYLTANPKIVNSELKAQDLLSGKKKYESRQQAVKGIIREMFHQYYGNR